MARLGLLYVDVQYGPRTGDTGADKRRGEGGDKAERAAIGSE